MSKSRGFQGGACAMAKGLTSDWKICKQSQIAFSTQFLILEGFYLSFLKNCSCWFSYTTPWKANPNPKHSFPQVAPEVAIN